MPVPAKQLQAAIDARLYRRTNDEDTAPSAVKKILSGFDRFHSSRLTDEKKTLDEGGSITALGTTIPVIFGRAIVRDIAANTALLEAVQLVMDNSGRETIFVPHLTRNVAGLPRLGRVYEGAEIAPLGISQVYDTAHVESIKIALAVSDEVMHFGTGQRDADALTLFIERARSHMEAVLVRRIIESGLRAADAFEAYPVIDEDIASQLDGERSLIKIADFPAIRPHQVRDFTGAAIGDEQWPVALIINSAAIGEWDGTGKQADGVYWALENPTMGFFRLVNQAGAEVTPTATGACTISYSSTTNIKKFDLKVPSGTSRAAHFDGAISAIVDMQSQIFARSGMSADFAFMPESLAMILTDAAYFTGSDARTDGLSKIKGLRVFTVNTASDLGGERILIGPSGTIIYAISQPLTFAPPFQRINTSGKQTYGVELSAVHVPVSAYARLSSVIVYDSDARAAAS